jgi:putative transposase
MTGTVVGTVAVARTTWGGSRGRRARGPRKLRRPVQLALKGIADAPLKRKGRGGTRPGAGRKLAPGKRRSVPHRKRPRHDGKHPVLVTLRALRGLPALRTQVVSEMLQRVLREHRKRHAASGFQVAEFSIQENHLHFVIEATGLAVNKGADAPDALRAGVSGLVIAFAKQLNKLLGRRKGKVWGDRWHGRELGSPSELRSALVYVLRNAARHGAYFLGDGAVDPYSSAPRFTGWKRPVKTFSIETEPWPPPPRPLTWMLGTGWRLIGLLDPNEARRRGP